MSKSPAFIKKVQEKLQKRKDELLAMLAGAEGPSKDAKDIGDEALSASMDKLQSSLEQSEIDEINAIDVALDRIKRDDYGTCLECDDEISDKRLEHSAFAARCIVCQEKAESGAF